MEVVGGGSLRRGLVVRELVVYWESLSVELAEGVIEKGE